MEPGREPLVATSLGSIGGGSGDSLGSGGGGSSFSLGGGHGGSGFSLGGGLFLDLGLLGLFELVDASLQTLQGGLQVLQLARTGNAGDCGQEAGTGQREGQSMVLHGYFSPSSEGR